MGSRRKQTPWNIGRVITMVLSSIDTEKKVTLIAITGGRGIKSKLYSMGLVPGVKLTVLNRNGTGPVMVAVKDSRLAIGHGMAEKIIVE
jgi:Fe2+ transport system protein FeoA